MNAIAEDSVRVVRTCASGFAQAVSGLLLGGLGAFAADPTIDSASQSVARTPVVVVAKQGEAPTFDSWSSVLRQSGLRIGNPLADTLAALQPLRALDGGGTGLYETTLAASHKAQSTYDPHFVNSVVIVTDGANEDPNGISLDRMPMSSNRFRKPHQGPDPRALNEHGLRLRRVGKQCGQHESPYITPNLVGIVGSRDQPE